MSSVSYFGSTQSLDISNRLTLCKRRKGVIVHLEINQPDSRRKTKSFRGLTPPLKVGRNLVALEAFFKLAMFYRQKRVLTNGTRGLEAGTLHMLLPG
jgi:hypothetical protein